MKFMMSQSFMQKVLKMHHRNLTIAVLGAEFDKGQSKSGTAEGPNTIRETRFIAELESLGHSVKDFGNITGEEYTLNSSSSDYLVKKLKNFNEVAAFNHRVSDKVNQLSGDYKVLTLGGDHSIGTGTVHGHLAAKPEACVLWIDAHADINTMESTQSGHLHGMPVSFLLKEMLGGNLETPEMAWLKHRISAKNIAFVGLRDVEAGERRIIRDLGICALSTEEVDQMGVKEATRYALSCIDPESRRPIHVSFDIDVLDPKEAPSTGTAVRGGLTLREGISLLEFIHRTGRLSALDLVEVNPSIGTKDDVIHTAEAAKRLILAAFGNSRKGNLM